MNPEKNKNIIRIFLIIIPIVIVILLGLLLLFGPLKNLLKAPHTGPASDDEYITNIEKKTIVIDGLEGTYHFLYVSDLHLVCLNDEISASSYDEVKSRYEFQSSNGHYAKDILPKIVEKANEIQPDAVLFGGDMLDFLTKENAEFLAKSLSELSVPYMFVTADHDTYCWWTDYTPEEEAELRKLLDTKPVQTMDFGEFIVLGVSDTTTRLTADALDSIKKTYSEGRPVIVVQHVPIDSDTEDAEKLRILSRQNWNDRVLLWGGEGEYEPDETTAEYLDILKNPSSKTAALLTGHLHLDYEGKFNETSVQYIFDPAYSGEIAYFTVTGNN